MALILGIETATKNCSVALFKDSKLIAEKEHVSDGYTHAEQLNLFIKEVVGSANITLTEIEAVALSMGPGSYTGLRIGTSTAKGLCYALEIPLLAISTLQAMAFGMAENESSAVYCPMIDARRMEVFSALFDENNKEIRGVQADVVDEQTYTNFLKNEVLFFGDGALKCKEIINHKNAKFIEGINPSAKNLGILANAKFENKDFEDVAYFEPYYLKDFVAGKKGA
ncbi:tRNA (adenosine(37)-N6)-threonylcarbamoyltransferase complex dimerization subunit type 1 TsaB [Flavobacteriales bacterium]|jgi:tRNA threonylcarbamoyladenosine biosynthesis protein TsaB|nr:tRNA (adenosine(37)-N6)-threonylcarbamoyltransferase complex dimerization subunit type 1 TsaB [Flavobacteriales bacterium]MDG1349234.1 tRNA (adenosine(37)-N6)-threonylcarbamoyltransferase complex dimerization subunit type 1 TsaB [Flavobacteriales bacterium]|tara:strand:- start:4491 stop:5165 length:675 start_codon:yes stop_codon:yes gene_type:complete